MGVHHAGTSRYAAFETSAQVAKSSSTSLRNRLMDPRRRANYTSVEREFARLLQRYLVDLLQDRRKRLPLLRKYPEDPTRIGVIPLPDDMSLDTLNLSRIEQMTWEALRPFQASAVGGPITQTAAPDGSMVEVQTFMTRYADIFIDRVDHFPSGAVIADSITWCLSRTQRRTKERVSDGLIATANLVLGLIELVQ